MDFLSQLSGDKPKDEGQTQSQSGGGLMGKINDALGGGQSGERKEGIVHRPPNSNLTIT